MLNPEDRVIFDAAMRQSLPIANSMARNLTKCTRRAAYHVALAPTEGLAEATLEFYKGELGARRAMYEKYLKRMTKVYDKLGYTVSYSFVKDENQLCCGDGDLSSMTVADCRALASRVAESEVDTAAKDV